MFRQRKTNVARFILRLRHRTCDAVDAGVFPMPRHLHCDAHRLGDEPPQRLHQRLLALELERRFTLGAEPLMAAVGRKAPPRRLDASTGAARRAAPNGNSLIVPYLSIPTDGLFLASETWLPGNWGVS